MRAAAVTESPDTALVNHTIMLQIKDYLRESNIVYSRIVVSAIFVLILVGVLVFRLWSVQVKQNEYFTTLSHDNRINLVPVAPVRGRIFDRNGEVLAENHAVYALEVVPDQVDDMDDLIDRLSQLLRIDDSELRRFERTLTRRPGFERLVLASGLTDAEAARFGANRHRFKGVDLVARLRRHYPHGALMGHVIGYVGRISEADLAKIDTAAYRGSRYIGKLGIEAEYEHALLGTVGFEQVETNAHGRIVRQLTREPATAGMDLTLTVDTQLQRVAEDALGDYRGAVVAIEPQTGDILAFVSKPSYDPNPFVDGIDSRSYGLLRSSKDRPLLNRALNGRYAPGSTIKGIMGLAVLDSGRSPASTVSCPGWFSLPNSRHRYRCWKKPGHGSMSLLDAIIQSCDVYFYRRARELGIDTLHRYLTGLGFGIKTGVDLPGEPSGLMPSRDWKRAAHGLPWYPGETVITGIGQGFMLSTPLQLAAATATLANRGEQVRPRFLKTMTNPLDGDTTQLPITTRSSDVIRDPENFDTVVKAMTDVVHGARGTARRIGKDSPYRMAGKTGTAQVIGIRQGEEYDEEKVPERFRDHALFVAFAPVEDPRIAVAVIAENGGSGSGTAAPVARAVLDAYLMDILKLYERPVVPDADDVQRGAPITDTNQSTEDLPTGESSGDRSAPLALPETPSVSNAQEEVNVPEFTPMGI